MPAGDKQQVSGAVTDVHDDDDTAFCIGVQHFSDMTKLTLRLSDEDRDQQVEERPAI